MKIDKFKVQVIYNNEKILLNIENELRQSFQNLPIKWLKSKDLSSAFELFKKEMPDVLIVDADMPNLILEQLLEEFKKIKGSIGCFFVGTNLVSDEKKLTYQFPILNWSSFNNQFFGFVHEELRIQFGLSRDAKVIHHVYYEYAKKLKTEDSQINKFENIIPAHFNFNQNINKTSITGSNVGQENLIKELILERSKLEYFFAVLIIIGLIVLSYYFNQNENFESENLLSIRNIFFIFTSLSVFTFFLLLPFNKILVKFYNQRQS